MSSHPSWDASVVVPASLAQSQIYQLLALYPHSAAAYNFHVALQIRGPLRSEVLADALALLCQRHEALRTGFLVHDGVPVQSIAPTPAPILACATLASHDAPDWHAQVDAISRQDSARPFDLARPPLIRMTLLRAASQDHFLLVTVHHLVFDAWSWRLLWSELCNIYELLLQGQPVPSLAPRASYRDHVACQAAFSSTDSFAQQLAYWAERFRTLPPPLELAGEFARPQEQSFLGGKVSSSLGAATLALVRKLALRTRSSPYIVMLAAFNALLYRLTGQNDIVIGAPFSGRTNPAHHAVIGLFLNTLALRTHCEGSLTFVELVAAMRTTVSDAHANQDVPFERVVQLANAERTLGRSPLFQVMFMFRDVGLPGCQLGTSQATLLASPHASAKYDLSFSVEAEGEQGAIELEYSADLFSAGGAHSILARYIGLLEAALASPGSAIAELPVLNQAERRLALEENAASPQVGPAHLCALFAEQCAALPDMPIVESEGRELSYRELDDAACQVAQRLAQRAVAPGALVGVLLPRSIDAIAATLGIMRAGCTFVPLDPAYPAERLAYMVSDAGLETIISTTACAATLALPEPSLLLLDRADPDGVTMPAMTSAPVAREPAYLMYTSGSTGVPKGVYGTHAAMAHRLRWMWQCYPLQEGEVLAQRTSQNFVDAIPEVYSALCGGAKLVILSEAVVKSPPALVAALAAHAVTRMFVVPSLLRVLTELYQDLGSHLPHLRYLVSSGEALTPELARKVAQALPACTLLNLYGSTEVLDATWCDATALAAAPALANRPGVAIGKPLPATRVFIIDRDGNLVPDGTRGEICIAGPCVSPGYHQRPALNAERFIALKLPNGSEVRVFKSGDFGMRQPDGVIHYLGRTDSLVKIRGNRVDLLEVQAALERHPLIAEAALLVHAGGDHDQVLVGYLRAGQAASVAPEAIGEFLSDILPSYMVPDRLIVVAAWPRLPNGKTDRARFGLHLDTRQAGAAQLAPVGPVEQAIAVLWRELLGVPAPGRGDIFARLGGHSLQAMKFVAMAEARFGLRFAPMKVLVKPLAALAATAIVLDQPGEGAPGPTPSLRAPERLA